MGGLEPRAGPVLKLCTKLVSNADGRPSPNCDAAVSSQQGWHPPARSVGLACALPRADTVRLVAELFSHWDSGWAPLTPAGLQEGHLCRRPPVLLAMTWARRRCLAWLLSVGTRLGRLSSPSQDCLLEAGVSLTRSLVRLERAPEKPGHRHSF